MNSMPLSLFKSLRRMRIIKQHDEQDCGAACLAMIAAHYGYISHLAKFRDITKTDRMGTTLLGIVDGARSIGFNSDAFQTNKAILLSNINDNTIKLPAIFLLHKRDNRKHFVVVFSYNKNKNAFVVGDPARGKSVIQTDEFFSEWTGYIVTFEPNNSFIKRQEPSFLKKFYSFIQDQIKSLIVIILLSILICSIGIAGAFVFKLIIDGIEGSDFLNNINYIFIALIALYILQTIIQYLRGLIVVKMTKTIDLRISLNYYNHLMDLPVDSINNRQTGDYLSRFSETYTIRDAVSESTVSLILDTFLVLGCGTILFISNKKLFLIALTVLVCYTCAVFMFKGAIDRHLRNVMEKDASLQSYIKESIDGIETLKALNSINIVKERAFTRFESYVNAIFNSNMIFILQDTVITAIELIGSASVLWVGFKLVFTHEISLGMLITFISLLSYFTEPIKNLIELQPNIQKAIVAIDRLNDILSLEKEELETKEIVLQDIWKVDYKNVYFRYGKREEILKGVDFSIQQGQQIAIVGETGSGKTTIAKLLLGFYKPESGNIFINDEPISKYSLEDIRKNISYIDQNTFLFSDSLYNNLTFLNPKVSDSELNEVCERTCVNRIISKLPYGLETLLEENGMNFSGGERQQIAIARALVSKPKLLIIDEATSNLDLITENQVKKTLSGLKKDITCIIIAHRLNTIKECDRILVLDKGRIIEQGNHESLIEQKGKYYEMLKIQ